MISDYPFQLDRFQRAAIAAVRSGKSVLVAAPTSSGKTVVAEAAIEEALGMERRAFYTAPIKALCNQKFYDLAARFGKSRVGLLTGDASINPRSRVVVMTTEVLRNKLYGDDSEIQDLAWVILDEVHFLEDPYRGAVWEEVVLNLPISVGIVALSATVSNAHELGDWLSAVRGPTDVIVERRRPVPLTTHYLVAERQRRSILRRIPLLIKDRPNREGFRFDTSSRPKRNNRRRHQRGGQGVDRRWAIPRRNKVATELDRKQMLPAIHFVFSRKGCEQARDGLVRSGVNFNTTRESTLVNDLLDRRLSGIPSQDLRSLEVTQWRKGLSLGIAAHHAGLVPLFKEIVEELFAMGLIKVVYATETLALGVNLPARSVVIENLTKFDGETHTMLTPGQFTQLTGRAGRRGIDEKGNALICWSPFVPFSEVADLAASREFVLRSAFRPTYNMVANLVATRTQTEAEFLLSRSFGQFQADRGSGEDRSLLDAMYARHAVLERRGCVEGWELTPTGWPLIRVFNECDLLVVESLAGGLFEGLSPPDLAAVVSSLTFRHRGPGRSELPRGDSAYGRGILGVMDLAHELAVDERRYGVPATELPDQGFAESARLWAEGADFPEVMNGGLSGGEFVRNVRLLVDLLGQLAEVGTPSVAGSARNASGSLERGVVALTGVLGGASDDMALGSEV